MQIAPPVTPTVLTEERLTLAVSQIRQVSRPGMRKLVGEQQ